MCKDASFVWECKDLRQRGLKSLCFPLVFPRLGPVPSTDGCFINIIEGWWLRGLFSASTWAGEKTSGHKHTLSLCFTLPIICTSAFSATETPLQASVRSVHKNKAPEECHCQGWHRILIPGWMQSSFNATEGRKLKIQEVIPPGNNNCLWTREVYRNNSAVRRGNPSPPSLPESKEFGQVDYWMCLSYPCSWHWQAQLYGFTNALSKNNNNNNNNLSGNSLSGSRFFKARLSWSRKKEAWKVSFMRAHLGIHTADQIPKVNRARQEPHRILDPNQQAWIILWNGHLRISTGPLWDFFLSKASGFWLQQRVSGKEWIKMKSRPTGKFPREKRTNGFCCQTKN